MKKVKEKYEKEHEKKELLEKHKLSGEHWAI